MAKTGKLRVPKKIAGVKVPKKVRKTANTALKFADHPVAMELAAAALTAAAASLRAKNGKGAGKAAEAAEDSLDSVREQAGKLKDLVIAAALDGARRLMEPAAAPAEPAEKAEKAEAAAPKPKRSPAKAAGRAASAAEPRGA
jgi:peptidoglycan hydrolase CwlO-like protein